MAWADGMQGDFEKIFRIFMKRIEQSLCSVISDSRMADAMPLIEAASNALRLTPTTRGGGSMLRNIEEPLAHIHNRGGA